MKALVTLLPEPYYKNILSLWKEMEERFGFTSVFDTPQPHITWQYGDDYKDGYLKILEDISLYNWLIEVQTDIVTWFAAEQPIIYLRVVKTPEIVDLHRVLWERLFPLCENPAMLYAPGSWQPHVTLAMEERSWLKLPEVHRFLKTIDLRWSFRLDNLTVLTAKEEKASQVEKKFLI
jgi:2'-5' RNA ligase